MMSLAKSADVIVPHHPGWGSRSGRNGCAACATSPSMHRGCLPISASKRRRWSGSALAAGSRPRWRRWRRATSNGWCWSARWASSRPRATSSTRRSSATSTTPAPASTTRRRSTRSTAMSSTDQLGDWDICREMCFRIAWKPYMYSQTLPHLLGGVRAPALVVWGDDDKIVPRSAGERYAEALPSARLEIVEDCGHCVDMEQPDELARLVDALHRTLERTPIDAATIGQGGKAMHLMYFTEQPMSAYPTEEGLKYGHTALMFSNKHFDPVAGSRLYNEYLEHYIYAEEVGRRRHHAERAPQRAVLHAGQVQHLRLDPRAVTKKA